MTQSKHTAGPWHVGLTDGAPNQARYVYGPDNYMVCDCSRIQKRGIDEQAANARLIAAAPELLEALEVYLMAGHKEARRAASAKAKEAIAKARGEL